MAKQATKPAETKPAAKQELAVPKSTRGEMVDVSNYSLLSDPLSLEAMIYNLQGEQLSEFDLDRIKVPAGGATVFQVPGDDGIDTNVEHIEGIILHIGIRRGYWSNPDPNGTPPDCYSTDGIHGLGNPGVTCAQCPFNAFGSAIKADGKPGRGKRCREMRTLLMVRSGDRLPIVVTAPPASLKNVKQYLLKGLPVFMYQAITRLTLKQEKNNDGIKYSQLVPHYVGHIDAPTAKMLAEYAKAIKSVLVGNAPLPANFFGDDDDKKQDDPNTIDGQVDPARQYAESINEDAEPEEGE